MKKIVIVFFCFYICLNAFAAFNTKTVREQSGLITLNEESFGFSEGRQGASELDKTKDGAYILRFISTNRYDSEYLVIELGKNRDEALENIDALMTIIDKTPFGEVVWITDTHSVYVTDGTFSSDNPRLIFSQKGMEGNGILYKAQLRVYRSFVKSK